MSFQHPKRRLWLYPGAYILLILIAFLPPIAEVPYDPRNTQDVIWHILAANARPYPAWGWVFHVATLSLIALAAWRPAWAGRAIPAYFGVNYWVIAAVQTHAVTEKYGFALHTGALVAEVLLGFLWLWVAWRGRLQVSFREVPNWRWLLAPLALLAFWTPVATGGNRIVPDFNPLLLLTSSDYGFAYCLMTPVFLFLLILFYPGVDPFAFHVTAFNGLLYGLFNLTHWASPDTMWMGVMHLPLQVMSIVALGMAWRGRKGVKT